MHPPLAPSLLSDAVDLRAEDKLDPIVLVQAVAYLTKGACCLLKPGRMGKVGGTNYLNTFFLCPHLKILQIHSW